MPLFFLIFLTVMALFHLYSYRRFVLRCQVCAKRRKLLRNLLIINYLGILVYILSRLLEWPGSLYLLGSLSIGFIFIFTVTTLLYDILHLPVPWIPVNPQRRAFFKKSADYGTFAIAAVYSTKGITENLKDPVIQKVSVSQSKLERPVRIVQISDLHITKAMQSDFVARTVSRINRLNPDIIAITGDLVDAEIEQIDASLNWLGSLQAAHGVYFVTGNHEYYVDTEAILSKLGELNVQVMDNKGSYLEALGLNIVGVPDFQAQRFAKKNGDQYGMDLPRATATINPSVPTLLLAHQPKTVLNLEDFKPDLTLSGHTHGGQLFPFNYLVRLAQPYVKGLHTIDAQRHIYVSSGTGYWGPPMRVGVPSEISYIEWG